MQIGPLWVPGGTWAMLSTLRGGSGVWRGMLSAGATGGAGTLRPGLAGGVGTLRDGSGDCGGMSVVLGVGTRSVSVTTAVSRSVTRMRAS